MGVISIYTGLSAIESVMDLSSDLMARTANSRTRETLMEAAFKLVRQKGWAMAADQLEALAKTL